ncbi:hypothetical protein ACFFGT_10435 [Mucilaginibacter angelicae]|uniref:Uncharacterized protein n=1 Tax=Mucilaginibacter angelicae TaxID=869718 RepID=A0ABV6L5B2_9SPHI
MKNLLKLAIVLMFAFSAVRAQTGKPAVQAKLVVAEKKTVPPVPAPAPKPAVALLISADTVKKMVAQVVSISTDRLSENQASDIAKIKKEIGLDSARRVCIAYPGTILHFRISNPIAFLADRPKDQAKVVIFVHGMEMKGFFTSWQSALTTDILKTKPVKLGDFGDIYISLKRNDTTQAAWNYLYNNKQSIWKSNADIDASIGWEGMSALQKVSKTSAPNVKVVFYLQWVLIPWIALFIVILAIFLYLALGTNVMRESGDDSAFSFSLTQLMFWTIMVIGGFIYILVLTDLPTGFNPSVLLMLGISVTTTGAATFIDARFKQANSEVIKKPTGNFLKDILTSDGTSYSVQRVQAFAWNLVLGLYFIGFTILNFSMPTFSSTLLFLAGITSAAYITTKGPENDVLKKQQTGEGEESATQAAAKPNTATTTPEQPLPATPTAVG